MSDKGDKDDDKKQQQSEIKNGVEKLIKIDKKHANFEINDTLLNTKVKVRNINSSTSSSILGQNQPENTLRCFWRHINRYYFRKLDANELERLSYLDQLFSLKQDTSLQRQKYANHMVYTAIQEVIDKEKFINDQQQQSPEVQKLIFKIVKASCNIQALIYECYYKDKANLKFLDQIIKEKEQITPKKSNKKKSINDLQNELQKLKAVEDKLLKQIELNSEQDTKHSKKKNGHQKKNQTYSDEDSNNSDEMDDDDHNSNNHDNISTASNDEISYYAKHSTRTLDFEQERLNRQLDEINSVNKQNLKKINQKVQAELKEGKLIYFENQNDNSSLVANDKHLPQGKQQTKQKKKSKKNNEYQSDHIDAGIVDTIPRFGGFQKELGKDPRPKMTEKEISDLHLNYLQQMIFMLEEKQVADSISKITNCKKESKKEYHYEVMFEDALNSQPIYIDEKTMLRFNEYREHSMLKQYNLPIKTLFSSTSHNFVQLTQFVTNRNKPNPYKDQDILDALKRSSNQHHDQTHHKIINLTRNFDICHHCRQIFELGYLIKCNYRSSVMGMPQQSQSTNDQIFISQIVDYDSNQRRPFLNRKRNNYNSYIKKSNGELVCKRKFCIHCLKQNYDFKHDQSKTDWVCPFCQNYCHCIRCLRNDQINKLKGIYLLYGGDIQYLEQESMLNKYLRPLSEEDRKRKERDDIYNRATNSSMIVFQVQKQTYEKEVEEEKTLQSKLDDLTYVRLDMEREQKIQNQLEKNPTKTKKQQEKEGKSDKSKKAEKAKNGATKKKEDLAKKSTKGKKRNAEDSEQETEDNQEESQSVQSDSQIEQSNQSSDIEQQSEEVNSEVENSSQEDNDEEEEQSSKSQTIEEEEVNQTDSSEVEQEESDEEEQQLSQEEESEEEQEEEDSQDQDAESSNKDEEEDDDDDDDDDENEEEEEEQTEDADDEESENEEVESIIQSDESTIEENQRNKQKNGKQKPNNGKKSQSKAQQKSKSKAKSVKKNNNSFVNKQDKQKAKKSYKKDPKSNKSKRGLSSLFSKEIKNLMRNQDPSILELSSKREKVLRSNINLIDTNHHNNLANGFSNKNKNINNHTKQNISKFEKTPQKKQKV